MSAETRDMIEERLADLRKQREQLKARAAELERIALHEAEVQDMVQDLGAFIAGLEVTLKQGNNDKRIAALRRCITEVRTEADCDSVMITLRTLPICGMTTVPTAQRRVMLKAN